MSNISQTSTPPTTAQPDLTATPPMEQIAAASPALANLQADPSLVENDVQQLLARAGFERSVDGAVIVKDISTVDRAGEVKGLSSAEKIYGVGETQLKPVAPPRIEINKDLRQGAESFAANLDIVLDNLLLNPGAKEKILASKADAMVAGGEAASQAQATPEAAEAAAAEAGTVRPSDVQAAQFRALAELSTDMLLAAFLKLNISDPNNSVETHNKMSELMTKLRQQSIDNAQKNAETAAKMAAEAAQYAEKAQMISTIVTVVMIVIAVVVSVLTFGLATGLMLALAAMVIGAMVSMSQGGSALNGASWGASILTLGIGLAAQAAATAAKTAAEAAKQTAEQTAKAATEAAKKAAQEAAQQATQQATNAALEATKTIKQVVAVVGQLISGGANYQAETKQADANDALNNAERARLLAEMMQSQIEEENAIMKMVMESKNRIVDSVMKMMQAMFAAQTKVMSAGMAR